MALVNPTKLSADVVVHQFDGGGRVAGVSFAPASTKWPASTFVELFAGAQNDRVGAPDALVAFVKKLESHAHQCWG